MGSGVPGTPAGTGGGLLGPPPRIDVEFVYRAVGKNALAVEELASAVASRIAVLAASGAKDRLGVRVQPVLFNVGSVAVRADNPHLLERGLPAQTSPSKNAGARYTRTDTYRLGVF